jgi:4-amino-4-deoxy-L-arabinose transferase-like glycosyltransferase
MRLVLLAAILLLAASLRFASLRFGPGALEARPDETGVVLTLAALERGEFFPMLVAYGGGYFHPLAVFVRSVGALVWDTGVTAHIASGDFDAVRVVARVWSALLALATVALVYGVGRRLRGERVGLLAAGLLAVVPLAVREAHFAKADTAAAAAAALVMAALVLPNGHGVRRGVLIGTATALALSTKLLVGVVPAAAFAVAWPAAVPGRRIDWRALAWGAGACVLGVVALNSFVWRFPSVSADSASHLLGALRSAAWLPGTDLVAGPLVYHATISLRWGTGLAVTILALPAIVFGLAQGGGLRLLALVALGLSAALLASPMVLARFFLPVLPALVHRR